MRWLAVLVITAACGGSTPQPAPAPTAPTAPTAPADAAPELEAELARIEAIQRQACACPDVPCLEEADRAYAAYVDVATLPDPIDGAGAWPEDLDARAGAVFAKLVACFDAKDTPLRVSHNHFAIRRIESVASHACACRDDACLIETRDALNRAEVGEMYDTGDPQEADRLRGAMTKLGRCLAPVLEDELAAMVADLEARRQQACACADAACGGAVAGALMTWMNEIDLIRAALVTNARVQALLLETSVCLQAVRPP